ncbi:MAG: MFS transporter [Candidatus Hermodarchaeota archaeon]
MSITANQGTFRSYLFFWLGQLVSLLGSNIVQFVIIWYITIETQSAAYLALASLLGFGSQVIITPLAGVYVDRWSRKLIIGLTDFLQASVTFVLIFLFFIGVANIWHILALLTLRGVFQAFHGPAVSAIIPVMVPRDRLSQINSVRFLFNGLVLLIGPVIAAFLMAFWEIGELLWVDVITFLIALVPLLLITIPAIIKQDSAQIKPSFKQEFTEGLTFIKNARGLLPFLLTASSLNFLLMPLSTLMPLYINFDHLGMELDLALVMAFLQGGIITGSLVMMLKGFKRKVLMITLAIYTVFIFYIILALTPTGAFWIINLSAFVFGLMTTLINVTVITIIQMVVPLEKQGRVNSVTMAISSAISPLGMIYAGIGAEFIGTRLLFVVSATLGLIVTTFSFLFTGWRYIVDLDKDVIVESEGVSEGQKIDPTPIKSQEF